MQPRFKALTIRIHSYGKTPQIKTEFHAQYKRKLNYYKTIKTKYVERKKYSKSQRTNMDTNNRKSTSKTQPKIRDMENTQSAESRGSQNQEKCSKIEKRRK
jgi:hypothetical protein